MNEFELNSMFLKKLGWISTDSIWEIYRIINNHNDINIYMKRSLASFSTNEYFYIINDVGIFIIRKHPEDFYLLDGMISNEYIIFGEARSNLELFRLIIKNLACNIKYKRQFKLSKILK